MRPSIMWFRRDLRIEDLPALHAAARAARGQVVALFVVAPFLVRPAGPNRRRFLVCALTAGTTFELARFFSCAY